MVAQAWKIVRREMFVMHHSHETHFKKLSTHNILVLLFFDVASFFVCLVLTEYVQRFEPQVGCSQRDSVP